MKKVKAAFRPKFEEAVVYNLATNPTFVAKFLQYLTADMFGTAPGKLVFKIVKTDARSTKATTRGMAAFEQRLFREVAEGRITQEAHDDALLAVFIGSQSDSDVGTVEQELSQVLQTYLKGVNVDDLITTYAKRGDIEPIVTQLAQLSQIGKAENVAVAYDLDSDFFEALRTEGQVIRIPTSADALDALINGGPARGETCLGLGTTGSGKSQWLCQVSAGGIVCGLSVAYIVLEADTFMVGRRIAAALSGLPIDLVAANPRWAEEVIRARGNKRGIFRMVKMPGLGTTVLDIRRQLRKWCNELGIESFDVIAVDYVDRMAGATHIMRDASSYQLGEVCMQGLRDIGEEHDAVLHTVSQTTRLSPNQGKQSISINDTAGSMHKPRIADFVFAFNNSQEQAGATVSRGTEEEMISALGARRFPGVQQAQSTASIVTTRVRPEIVVKVVKARGTSPGLKTPKARAMYAWGHALPSTYLPLYDPASDWNSRELLDALAAWQLQTGMR